MAGVATSAAAEVPAPDPEIVLRDDLVGRHGEALLSLLSAGADGPLIAVLDGETPSLDVERQRLQTADIAVEVLDRASYEVIRRLEAAGTVHFAKGGFRELHRSPRLDDGGRAARLERAGELTAAADRKLRMAALLAGGGFLAESGPPVCESMALALHALAAVGESEPSDGDDDLAGLAGRLHEAALLPIELKRGIEAEPAESESLTVAERLVAHVRTLIEHAGRPSHCS